MLDTATWIYNKLISDTDLIALLGSTDHVMAAYPYDNENSDDETIDFPYVIYTDKNQADEEFADNSPIAINQSFTIDIYTKTDSTYPTSTAIGILVDNIFRGLFFSCDQNGLSADPDNTIEHRILSYSNNLLSSDLV